MVHTIRILLVSAALLVSPRVYAQRADSLHRDTTTARGAGAMSRYGDVPAKKYGDAPAPKYGDVPAPKYGDVPAPKSGDVVPAPTNGTTGTNATKAAPVPKTTAPTPSGFSGHYFRLISGSNMEMWDFAPGGTYSRTQVAGGGGFSGRSSETGTYEITGSTLVIHPATSVDASTTTATGGKSSTLTGGTNQAGPTQRLSFKLIGPEGKNGAEIDGKRFGVKNW